MNWGEERVWEAYKYYEVQFVTAGQAWQQEPGVSQPFWKLADRFHPHRESRGREEKVDKLYNLKVHP